jgi:Uma2 family endonuclease
VSLGGLMVVGPSDADDGWARVIGMTKKDVSPNEQRIVLNQISWQKYEQILSEMGGERQAHLTYDRGKLELMTPLEEHERCSKLIESLLSVLGDELQESLLIRRDATLKQIDLQQALEPNLCCYRGTAPTARETCPDLILDISLRQGNIDPFPIYANFGIPEVWRYRSGEDPEVPTRHLEIYHLREYKPKPPQQPYLQAKTSLNFPFLSATTIQQFLDQSDTLGLMPALKLLRAWMKEQG